LTNLVAAFEPNNFLQQFQSFIAAIVFRRQNPVIDSGTINSKQECASSLYAHGAEPAKNDGTDNFE
jgi:hypothetical protein